LYDANGRSTPPSRPILHELATGRCGCPLGPLEVGKHQDVEEFGASLRYEANWATRTKYATTPPMRAMDQTSSCSSV
jgi:hypothetical protein